MLECRISSHMFIVRFIIICLVGYAVNGYAESALDEFAEFQRSSLLVLNDQGESVYERNSSDLRIPASTVKLLTALMAIDHWGREHRFATEFYIDNKNYLIIKGLGDPFLVSEEIDLIVSALHALGMNQFTGIAVDTCYFEENIQISGQGVSNNPYDASVNPLAANFNTLDVRVNNGRISSGEPQTPMTPLAFALAKTLANGKHRINLGKAEYSAKYFVELLTAKLQEKKISVVNHGIVTASSKGMELLYTHFNSRTLQQVISAMLEYSNNFIANQLYLLLGAEKFGAPATKEKSQHYAKDYISQHFHWDYYSLEDGAGLSRNNRLSARQLMDVLIRFADHQDLMPKQNSQIFAKSGTLNGVSTYAGYLQNKRQMLKFAMLINQPVRYRFREQFAEELLKQLDLPGQ